MTESEMDYKSEFSEKKTKGQSDEEKKKRNFYFSQRRFSPTC